MISPLGQRAAHVFSGVPRLRFRADQTGTATQGWSDEVKLLVRRSLDDLEDVTAERRGDSQIGGLAAQTLLFRSGDEARFRATERLSRYGFVTLAIDYGLREALAADASGRDETSLLAHALALQDRSLLGCLAADACAALRWLEREMSVDEPALGLLGHSLGGHIALHAALKHDRRLPLVLASCAGSYETIFWRDLSGGGAHALPGVLQHADMPDLMAAHAPGFLEIQHGKNDHICPVTEAVAAIELVAAAYHRFNVDVRLDAAVLPMGHGVDANRAARFFTEAFADAKPNATRPVPPIRVHFEPAARRQALDLIAARS